MHVIHTNPNKHLYLCAAFINIQNFYQRTVGGLTFKLNITYSAIRFIIFPIIFYTIKIKADRPLVRINQDFRILLLDDEDV